MAPRKRKHEDTLSPSQPKLSFGSRPIQQEQVKEHSENILAVEVPANPTNDSPPLDQTPLIPVKSEQQPEKSNKSGGEEIPKQAAIKAEVKEAIAPKPMKRTASFTPRPKMPEKDRIRTELAKVADLQRPLEEGEETNPEGLEFQLLDADDCVKEGEAGTVPFRLPLIRLFGCTRKGHSVMVIVQDFLPYFYFPVSKTFGDQDLAEFLQHCRDKVPEVTVERAERVKRDPLMYFRPEAGDKYSNFLKITVALPKQIGVLSRYLCSGKVEDAFGQDKFYDPQAYEANMNYILRLMVDKDMAGGGWITIPQDRCTHVAASLSSSRCQLNLTCSFEDLVVHPVNDSSKRWSSVAPLRILTLSTFVLLPSESQLAKQQQQESTSKRFKANNPSAGGKKGKAKAKAKARGSDQDSETSDQEGRPGNAPEGDLDDEADDDEGNQEPIGAIANVVNIGEKSVTVLFTHREDFVQPSETHLLIFDTERQMLLAWKEFFLQFDPDVLTGFDSVENMALILDRAEQYGLDGYPFFGRIASVQSTAKRAQLYRAGWIRSQRRMANNSNEEFLVARMVGRVSVDLKQVTERTLRLRSYSFAEVCQETFGTPKETFDSKLITTLFRGDEEDHVRLLHYITREVALAQRLFQKSAALYNSIEMARVTGLNMADVMEKGQMIRFWSQLFRYCRRKGVVIPTIKGGNSGMQLGAINLMPEVGYYTKDPVAVLDFASLYPSIIIANNLCYSTLIHAEDKKHFAPDQLTEGATGAGYFYFVKNEVKKGIVPEILETFLSERTKAKKMMEETPDPDMKAVLDGRQQALKTSANAIYGFTGAQASKLQCLPIAECTIDFGAQMMMTAKQMIESSRIFGINCKVVYGDTDSLFVSFPGCSVKTAMESSQTLAIELSERFIRPIKIKFEKIYFPAILLQKKRYAGLQWTNPDAPDKVDVKGVENTNRGSSGVLINLLDKVFDIIHLRKGNDPGKPGDLITMELRKQAIQEASNYTKEAIRALLSGNIDLGELIMTKALWLGTDAEDYKVKQAHVELADRIRKREPDRVFKSGERIPYVYIQSPDGDRGYNKTEDPVFVMQHGLPVDLMYYYEHQLKEPLKRVFQVLLSDEELNQLLSGEHTRIVNNKYSGGTLPPSTSSSSSSSSSSGLPPKGPEKKGITSFFKQSTTTTSCLGCKARIPSETTICKSCAPRAPEIRDRLAAEAKKAEEKLAELVGTCQTCQGCKDWEIVCVNTECPVFYRRPKAEADAKRHQDQLKSLKW